MDLQMIGELAMGVGLVACGIRILMQDSRIAECKRVMHEERQWNLKQQDALMDLRYETASGFDALGLEKEPQSRREARWVMPVCSKSRPEQEDLVRQFNAFAASQANQANCLTGAKPADASTPGARARARGAKR